MLEKLKNIFKSSKAKISFLFLAFLGLVVPKITSAYFGEGVVSWITGGVDRFADPIVNGIMYLIFSVVLFASGLFLEIAQFFLNKVISSDFITISFTGADNIIVQQGWTMVRDFTNMFIVLGFVVIALATILRIKEYHAQKLLPLLIGIALLINFTPVICGFIIDVSNITMNHFLQGAGIHDSFILNSFWDQCAMLNNVNDNEPVETLAMGLMFSGFAITAGIMYFLFAVLFIFRYIALWILIILSPLAFFSYILPATKSGWNLWWKQFFQWCIIGIPAAFFLYLSKMLSDIVKDGTLTGTHGVEGAGFEIMISYTIIIAFLLIGFLVSLQTGAMGAEVVTKATKGAVQGTAKWAGAKAKETIGDNRYVKGGKEWAGSKAEGISGWRPTKRGRAKERAKQEQKREKDIQKDVDLMKNMSSDDLETRNSPLEKIARFRINTERGSLDPKKDFSEDNIKLMKQYGSQKDLKNAAKKMPNMAGKLYPEKVQKEMNDNGIGEEEAEGIVIQKQMEKMKSSEIKDIQVDAFKNKHVVSSMSPDKIKGATTKGTGEQKKNIYETLIKEDILFSLKPEQAKEFITQADGEQRRDIYNEYSKEVGQLIKKDMSWDTPDDLGTLATKNSKKIQEAIDILRGKGGEYAIKAEVIAEIHHAVYKRKKPNEKSNNNQQASSNVTVNTNYS